MKTEKRIENDGLAQFQAQSTQLDLQRKSQFRVQRPERFVHQKRFEIVSHLFQIYLIF